MIVVDLGCVTYPQYPEDESIHTLIERFKPSKFYGFDPHPSQHRIDTIIGPSCEVKLRQKAAWIYDGFIGYQYDWNPLRAWTGESAGPMAVPCFDLAPFLEKICEQDDEVIVKMDVEGAEYTLVPYLMKQGITPLLTLMLVEWHLDPLKLPFGCPVERW